MLPQSLSRLQPGQLVIIAACLTAIVTFTSVRELHGLIGVDDTSSLLPAHTDWLAVAERAVEHVEHLPHLPKAHPLEGLYRGASDGPVGPFQPASSAAPSTAAAATSPAVVSSITKPSPAPATCNAMEHTEYWGDVVKWGSSFRVDSAGDCCKACEEFKPSQADSDECNVWVWCADEEICEGQYKECWLKHLVHPRAAQPARSGRDVGWMSGMVGPDAAQGADSEVAKDDTGPVRKYHVVTSAQGSAVHWQVRVHYYWYKKQKAECEKGPRCEMGGFTRLLHSGAPDDLMDEMPTFVADPLPESVVHHEWYPVLNRPYAFVQWVKKAKIEEDYVLMSEPDHIFLRPLPNLMRGDHPAAFPFFYIEPHKDENIPIVAKFLPEKQLSKKDAQAIAPIGNSPTFLTFEQMKEVMPLWHNLSVDVFKDKEANEKWGWVQEMYAFTIALYRIGVRHVDLALHLMSQPPWDSKMLLSNGKPYYILHYTYGCDYTFDGKFTPGKYGEWRFDKRTYANKPPPRYLGAPPKGMDNDLVRALINSINEASAAIPCWDEYAKAGKIVTCDEMKKGT